MNGSSARTTGSSLSRPAVPGPSQGGPSQSGPSQSGSSQPGTLLDHLVTLGDETRTRLLLALEKQEFTVGELCRILQLPQSTVSRHLKVLADAGWVHARSEGTSRPYRFVLPGEAGMLGLWRVVREGMAAAPAALEDAERAAVVLAERRERSRSFFRTAAGRWDNLRTELFGANTERLALFGLLDPGWVVADLGCGTGALSAAVAPSVSRVVAVDREPEMLEAAAARLADRANVELRQGELESLPLADGEVDVAFCSLVLHLVPEPRRVLAEVARILRPGGTLVLVDMRAHDREEYRDEMGHLWTGFTGEVVEAWMEEAGFSGIRLGPLPPDPAARGPLLFVARGGKG